MSILDVLSPYKLMIEVAVVGSLVVGAGVGIHNFLEHERDIGRSEVRAQDAKDLAAAVAAADKRTAELQTQLNEAIKNGQDREQTIRSLAAASGTSSASLRDALSRISVGVPSASIDALRVSTSTLASVLGECQGRYRDMAEKADRHASDVQTLMDAWPK